MGQQQRQPQRPRRSERGVHPDRQVQEGMALVQGERCVQPVLFTLVCAGGCGSAASSSEPTSRTVSSPNVGGSRTSSTPPSSTSESRNVDAPTPNSWATNRRDSTARSLDNRGPTWTEAWAGDRSSYQAQNAVSPAVGPPSYLVHDPPPVGSVRQQYRQVRQGGPGQVRQGQDRMAGQVVRAWPPSTAPTPSPSPRRADRPPLPDPCPGRTGSAPGVPDARQGR
jgi:hypothetical protein